jgi:hypothetical protein
VTRDESRAASRRRWSRVESTGRADAADETTLAMTFATLTASGDIVAYTAALAALQRD